jgi:hypothetical protein
MKRTIRLTTLTALAAGAFALAPGAANGALTLTPASLTFSQPVGTTSAPQKATLELTCGDCFPAAAFEPTVATTPAAFSQTNDCGPLFVIFFTPDPDSCTINVAFAANTAGTVSGTLTTGMGGPTATLTGTGVAAPAQATPPAVGTKGKCKKGKKKSKGAAAARKKGCGKKRGGK